MTTAQTQSRSKFFKNHDFPSPFDGARLGGGYHHQDALEETRKIRYSVQGAAISEQLFDPKDPELGSDTSPPYGSYDIIHETRGNYESIYDTQVIRGIRYIMHFGGLNVVVSFGNYLFLYIIKLIFDKFNVC